MELRNGYKVIYEKAKKDKEKYRSVLKTVLELIYPDTTAENSSSMDSANGNEAQKSRTSHQAINVTQNTFTFAPSQELPEEKEPA